jgi:hypothetical protein
MYLIWNGTTLITEYPRLSGTHLVLIFGQVVRGVEDLQHFLYIFGGTVVARVQYHVERLDGTVLLVGVVPTDVQMTVVPKRPCSRPLCTSSWSELPVLQQISCDVCKIAQLATLFGHENLGFDLVSVELRRFVPDAHLEGVLLARDQVLDVEAVLFGPQLARYYGVLRRLALLESDGVASEHLGVHRATSWVLGQVVPQRHGVFVGGVHFEVSHRRGFPRLGQKLHVHLERVFAALQTLEVSRGRYVQSIRGVGLQIVDLHGVVSLYV